MTKLTQLLIATGNPGKRAEFKHLLAPLGIEIFSKIDFPNLPDPEETGSTLEENALIKAKAAFEATGLISLSDDTGLEVDALDGAPGIHSARYSDPDATPEKNINKLLAELASNPLRTARFRTVLAIYPIDRDPLFFEGVCEGFITKTRSGSEGFGYDPVFRPDGFEKTFADMTATEKNQISHRGRALKSFLQWVKANA